MSVIDKKDTAEIRNLLKSRYGLDLQEKITRVEFISRKKTGVYFHVNDGFEPPKPPQVQYAVVIHTPGGEVRRMQFKSEKTMDTAFESFKNKGDYTVFAIVDGVIRKKYMAK